MADANENLLQTASATGGIRGGNTAGAIAQLAPDLLQKYAQQALSGYGNLAQLGLGAQGMVTQVGSNTADNVTSLLGQIGKTQAGNFISKGGINAANFTNFGKVLDSAAKAGLPGAGVGFSLGSALKSIFN